MESYVYDAGDKLQSVTWSGGYKNYSYDAAGNTKTIATPSGTTTLNYDEEGRLTGIVYPSAATNAFSYNGFRARRTITDSAGTRSYLRDGQDASSNIVSNGQGFPYPGGLGERKNWTTLWHHGGLKNVDGRSTTAGALTGTKRYDAFGNEKATSGWWGAVPTVERYGGNFEYQSDSDSGLMLLGNRYYDAGIGRFTSVDPIKSGRNWLTYASNNPASRVDPDGLDDTAPWIGYGIALRIAQMPHWAQRMVLGLLGWSHDRLQAILRAGNAVLGGPRGMITSETGLGPARQRSLNAADYGRQVHREIEQAYVRLGQGWKPEEGLGSAGRADLVNVAQRRVIEIKPYNPDKIWSYLRQVERYAEELERIHGVKFDPEILFYPKWTPATPMRFNRRL